MKYIEDAYTLCPFYRKESKSTIVCEGVCDNVSNIIRFEGSKDDFKEKYCRSKYKNCLVHSMLITKYYD